MKNKIFQIEGKQSFDYFFKSTIIVFVFFRLQEDATNLNRKLEGMKNLEMVSNKDEVLLEKIRKYKEIRRYPACEYHQCDTILSKCFLL